MEKKILFAHIDDPKQPEIKTYISKGGYTAWEKVLKEMSADDVIGMVKKAGVRGRGGAGFPAGMKWSFVPKDSPKPKYLVCNADESEPGTCKDRVLMEQDPHQVVEGMAIAAYAIKSNLAFIYIRGEFDFPARQMRKAIQEAYKKGHAGQKYNGQRL